ncbi:Cupin domain-containing protein [Pseudonocardia ammonioxydans]|uniref:Cupin domain-containing protein n=1 Tax=Pseudonocardia ammonioxydans TaxID=260086 RepID=A0A1I5BYT2_PSUAM|nr:cupin domain-containing protein [Pseudonocardia ammonioxydans]SFN79854.1 Cupin domain-containing protein [Pseudonocardia ammonioxydans]
MRERAGRARFAITLHGGERPSEVQWYFREQSTLPVAIQRWELPPGGSEGMHAHPPGAEALEEVYVLLEGAAVMTVDGERFDLGPGDAVLAPPGTQHDLVNPGPAPASVLVVWGPPGTAMDWASFRTGRASRDAAERDAAAQGTGE